MFYKIMAFISFANIVAAGANAAVGGSPDWIGYFIGWGSSLGIAIFAVVDQGKT
jgi:hypothetical protein